MPDWALHVRRRAAARLVDPASTAEGRAALSARSVRGQLRAFTNEVRAQRGKHLSETQADGLLDAAEQVFQS